MLIAKWLWTIDFFFFALILLFLWSKKAILTKKVKNIEEVLNSIDEIRGVVAPQESSSKPEQ